MGISGTLAQIRRLVREKGLTGSLRRATQTSTYQFYVKRLLPARNPIPPLALQVETASVCNLRCRMCEYAYQGSKGKLMSLNDFKTVLDRFPKIISLDLTGIGEPLCNPEFTQMVAYAKDRGADITFSTNGMLLTDERIDKLVRAGTDLISFSVDAATKDTYERIRVGASFETLKRNIKALTDKAATGLHGKPRTQMTYTVSRDNLAEAGQFPALARELGVDTVFYRDLFTFEGSDYDGDTLTSHFDEAYIRNISETILAEAARLEVTTHLCSSLTGGPAGERMCYRPWTTCYIDVTGNFYPCCRITQHGQDISVHSLGNILKNKTSVIWNSSPYRHLREGIARSTFVPAFCEGCPSLRKPPARA